MFVLIHFSLHVFFPQDYELQVVTYKALQDPIASPMKKAKMESASDNIIQEVSVSECRHVSSSDTFILI